MPKKLEGAYSLLAMHLRVASSHSQLVQLLSSAEPASRSFFPSELKIHQLKRAGKQTARKGMLGLRGTLLEKYYYCVETCFIFIELPSRVILIRIYNYRQSQYRSGFVIHSPLTKRPERFQYPLMVFSIMNAVIPCAPACKSDLAYTICKEVRQTVK